MQRFDQRVFAFHGLLIYLLISQLAMPMLVMCLGADGHMAVEATHAPSSSSEAQEHGGPCLDAPVLIARANDRPVKLLSDFVLSAHLSLYRVFATLLSHTVSVNSSSLEFRHAWSPKSSLISLRSVLLLI